MTGQDTTSESVRQLLDECIERRTRVYVTCPEQAAVFEGYCVGTLRDEVIIDVVARSGPRLRDVVVPTTQVLLSFTFDQKSRCCLANARRMLAGDDAAEVAPGVEDRLVLSLPGEIATSNGRQLYRVDTSVIEGIECMVGVRGKKGGNLASAVVQNISDSGVFLTFKGAAPDLKHGDVAAITVTFQSSRVSIEGVLRRKTEDGLAFYFPSVVHHPELESPAELRSLVQALERAWLAHRVRTTGYGYD